MEDTKSKAYLEAAKSLDSDYGDAYISGYYRCHFGSAMISDADDMRFRALDGELQERGEGYRDGSKGRPPRGYHGNLGNQNAAGADADSHLHIRLPSRTKAAYVKAAQRDNMKLSAWVLAACDKALKGDK